MSPTNPIPPDAGFALDPQALAGLKRAARDSKSSPDTLKQVAGQFEALFMQMLLKSMREASFGDDLFGGGQGDFYRDLYDQQLSVMLAKRTGLGLADVLAQQLGGARAKAASAAAPAESTAGAHAARDPQAFVHALWPHAERAAKTLGVAPEAIVSVAALETGWGGSPLRHADGRSANNFFGIKADAGWNGARVQAPTREVVDGIVVMRNAAFRAYASPAEGVDDFVRFVRDNPRYRAALGQNDPQAFVAALAAGGYATDPAYARKAGAILKGDTLRAALATYRDVQVSRETGSRERPTLKNSGAGPIPA